MDGTMNKLAMGARLRRAGATLALAALLAFAPGCAAGHDNTWLLAKPELQESGACSLQLNEKQLGSCEKATYNVLVKYRIGRGHRPRRYPHSRCDLGGRRAASPAWGNLRIGRKRCAALPNRWVQAGRNSAPGSGGPVLGVAGLPRADGRIGQVRSRRPLDCPG